MTTRNDFADDIVRGIGGSPSDRSRAGLVAAMVAVDSPGLNNPLGVTRGGLPGITDANADGVKSYPEPALGVNMTLAELLSGPYGGIVQALLSQTSEQDIARAFDDASWPHQGGPIVDQVAGVLSDPSLGTVDVSTPAVSEGTEPQPAAPVPSDAPVPAVPPAAAPEGPVGVDLFGHHLSLEKIEAELAEIKGHFAALRPVIDFLATIAEAHGPKLLEEIARGVLEIGAETDKLPGDEAAAGSTSTQ